MGKKCNKLRSLQIKLKKQVETKDRKLKMYKFQWKET